MKIISDMHCHTVASNHAYSTLRENISEAKNQGLYAIAITDHGPRTPYPPCEWYYGNLHILPKKVDGVHLLKGIEANVINRHGDLDIPDVKFDWVVASIHSFSYESTSATIEETTEAWLNVAKNPLVNVIGHSGSPEFVYDYEKVIPEFGRNNKLVEINNSSFVVRKNSKENCKRIAEICKKHGVYIILNSDAHFCTQVGRFDESIKLLEEIDFPEELIINSNVEKFKSYLENHTNFFD